MPRRLRWQRVLLLTLLIIASALASDAADKSEPSVKVRALALFPKESQSIKAWMKLHGWEAQRGNPKHFRIGDEVLRMVSRDDSVAIGTERGFPLSSGQWPRLAARFRVIKNPTGTDLTKKRGDDSAFRIYVAFNRGRGLISPPHTIAYTWSEKHADGRWVQSAHFDNLKYLTIGHGLAAPDADPWQQLERDLAADYRRAFPGEKSVPAISGVLLKCDSNNTGTAAESWVSQLELRGAAPKAPARGR